MKFILNKDMLEVEDLEILNSGSVEYYEADIEYDDTWHDLNKVAIIVKKDNEGLSQSVAVVNDKIFIDQDIKGKYSIGFIGYTIENDKKVYQISSNLVSVFFNKGAGEVETVEKEIPTPSEWEIYISQMQEISGEIESLGNELDNKVSEVIEKLEHGDFDGKDGEDGYTPVKGVDYFTQEDKQEIENDVVENITPMLNNNLKTSKDYTDNAIVRDFKDISYNTETATFIFTRHDNTTFTVDLPIEETVKNGRYDDEKAELVLVLVSGQEIRIPVTGLIDDYTGVDSATIQVVISADNKIACNIKSGSISKTLLTVELQKEISDKANRSELPTSLSDLSDDNTHRTVTDIEKTTWNNKSDFSGSYTDLNNNPFILRNDEEYSSVDINSLVPSDGSSACYQFLNPVFITNLLMGDLDLASGNLLNINSGSAAVVCSSGNYYFYPSSTTTEQGLLWDGGYCVDRSELDLLLRSKVETAILEEKDLLITYEDLTTETVKLVVYK